MKRDMDLIRAILIEVEKSPFDGSWHEIEVAGHDDNEISYHVLLLNDAGLIEAQDVSNMVIGVRWLPKRLTYAGHEFLDAAREETLWNKAKEKVLSSTGTLTVEALKTALALLMKQALTGGT